MGISSGLSVLSGEWGVIRGKFTGVGGSFDETTPTGWGTQAGGSVEAIGGGFWQGYASETDAKSLSNPTFIGWYGSFSTTLPLPRMFSKKKSPGDPGGSVGFTYSTLTSFQNQSQPKAQ